MARSSNVAFDLEARVLAARQVERRTWVLLAEQLYEFHAAQAWSDLGWDKFIDWLGAPEIGLGRRHAYRLIQAWAWAADEGISRETLEALDLSKLALVIPAITRGDVGAQEAISDCEVLSRSDLAIKYGNAPEMRVSDLETCSVCGRQRKMLSDDGPDETRGEKAGADATG